MSRITEAETMTNEETKQLALSLLKADTEAEVIELLSHVGLWQDEAAWRLYGDRDGNFATIGNQQSRPEAALIEKLVNSVDARLMNECLIRGIDPRSEQAPPSIRHAVSRYMEQRELQGEIGGTVRSWPKGRQLEQSLYVTLAATGSKTSPCLVIADQGEGQTPGMIPETFLSIDRSNKLRIPFVQGKFNMGGTGVLKFCGKHSLQLLITKRNPTIVQRMRESDGDADRWGVTVVRRERPRQEAGAVRNSVFRYLAPVGANDNPNRGDVLSFASDTLPLMPEQVSQADNTPPEPYHREIAHGSCIKLYEYDMKGFKSNVLRDLLSRLEALLPEIALPVRVFECRDYRGKPRSYANSLVGLTARLTENRAGNVEDGYPDSSPFRVHGQEMLATIYAFKGDKAESYRTNEGIIFTINGQTHGAIPKTFFSRKNVKMGRLAKSLLVVVDCSKLSVDAREDLFMNSRDRLSGHELRKAIEEALEDLISKHPGLRELRDRRRQEEIADRLQDSKPLEDVLQSILKSSPSLQALFLLGQRLSRPHKSGSNGNREGGGGGSGGGTGPFVGRPHPTYFRFHRKKDGDILQRNAEMGRRCRVKFDTDVVNDYFSRDDNRGHYSVEVIDGAADGAELDSTLTLYNGIANWSISIPDEDVEAGDKLTLQCTIRDDVIGDPIVNMVVLTLVRPSCGGNGGGSRDRDSGNQRNGTGGSGSTGKGGTQGTDGPPAPAGIAMPEIIEVKQDSEPWQKHEFTEHTACKIIEDAEVDANDEDQSVYTFYVNVDNLYLRTDMKRLSSDVAIAKAKFVFGNVLLGLALIHEHRNRPKTNGNGDSPEAENNTVEAVVEQTTRAVAPFLVPMIDYLGALTSDEVAGLAQAGDDE